MEWWEGGIFEDLIDFFVFERLSVGVGVDGPCD